ncbi:hypothetical protein [Streptomyces sp. NPDC054962]
MLYLYERGFSASHMGDASALELRPDEPREEIERAVGVTRGSARDALEDLREIIGVLRAGGSDDSAADRPQPRIAAQGALVTECCEPGMKAGLAVPSGRGHRAVVLDGEDRPVDRLAGPEDRRVAGVVSAIRTLAQDEQVAAQVTGDLLRGLAVAA